MKRTLMQFRSIDWLFVCAVFALVLIGLAAIYSIALSQNDYLNFNKQLFAVFIGAIIFFVMAFSNYRLLRNYALVLYILAGVSLVSVLFFGENIRGTTGWFSFGFVSIQPVEFVKLVIIIVLAAYFSNRARNSFGLKELAESGAIVLLFVFLIFAQPDLGSALLVIGLWCVMMLFAGIKKRYFLSLCLLALIASIFSWSFLFADYQKARITTFIDPASDPLGQGYNVAQAVIAVGSGGWFGRGLGFGSQSQLKFLPESHTDFIFAVIAEELGFVGMLLIVGAFGVIFWKIYHYASMTRDSFTSYLMLGVGTILFLQLFVNIGMNLGLLPVTGLGLPLVSYGGSSIIFTFLLLGIVASVALHTKMSR
ncbi:MAG: rod shape-determining protein RodA [Patescibacteria group bacterium]